eukprot:m.1059515 g.1059515  ORF g.1059515 m.1059515 type:complete len:209 (+) comp24209_c0_seq22:1183-1809(+)
MTSGSICTTTGQQGIQVLAVRLQSVSTIITQQVRALGEWFGMPHLHLQVTTLPIASSATKDHHNVTDRLDCSSLACACQTTFTHTHLLLATGYGHNTLMMAGAYARNPLEHRLPRLKVDHVSLIYGETDWMNPENGFRVRDAMKADKSCTTRLDVAIVTNAGHTCVIGTYHGAGVWYHWRAFQTFVLLHTVRWVDLLLLGLLEAGEVS